MKLSTAKILDEYDLRARLLPALIVGAPVLAAVLACVPSARSGWGLLSAILEVPFLYLLVRVARTEGYKIESRLYEAWGGKPTTAMLRHRDLRIDPLTKERYKTTIANLTGIAFPGATAEEADPGEADTVYGSATKQLLEHRRDKAAHRLIFNENCNYGFARNLLGLKKLGLVLTVLCLIATLGVWWYFPDRFAQGGELAILLSIAVAAMLVFYVTPETVRHHAEAYAAALLRSCEPPAASSTKRRTPARGSKQAPAS